MYAKVVKGNMEEGNGRIGLIVHDEDRRNGSQSDPIGRSTGARYEIR